MVESPHRLQPLARAKVAALGSAGSAWLADLPELLGEVERQWTVRVTRPVAGGSASHATRARRADGTEVVIKVARDDAGPDTEAATLGTLLESGSTRWTAPARSAMVDRALRYPVRLRSVPVGDLVVHGDPSGTPARDSTPQPDRLRPRAVWRPIAASSPGAPGSPGSPPTGSGPAASSNGSPPGST